MFPSRKPSEKPSQRTLGKALGKAASKSSGKPEGRSKPKSESKHSNSRKHPQITDNLWNPKGAKYYPRDLTRALRANTKTPIASRLDDREMMLILHEIPPVNTERDSYVLMNTYLPIFDKAFFFGLVQRRMKGPIEIYNKPKAETKGYFDNQTKKIHINLANAGRRGKDIAHSQLATMLHEMTHAFLDFYSCTCSICRKKNSATKGGEGKSGHGPTWINAMIALQDNLQELVNWPVNCGIVQSVALERRKSRKWKPRADQLVRWRLQADELDYQMDNVHNDDEKDLSEGFCFCAVM